MKFHIDKHSSNSAVRQVQEQIKLAVTMGVFRPDDTVASIRDVEKQTGINRGLIHKAYLGLRKSGLLTLAGGKGSVISMEAPTPPPMNEVYRRLSAEIISKTGQIGLSPTAFARYMSVQAQEDERHTPFIVFVDIHKEDSMQWSEQIAQLWQVPVVGLGVQELQDQALSHLKIRKVPANYFLATISALSFAEGK